MTKYSFSDLDSVDSALTLTFDLKVPNSITRQGDIVFLHIDPFRLSDDWDWLGRSSRRYNIEFNFPATIEKTINVTYPANSHEIMDLPHNSILQTDILYYEKDYSHDHPGRITATEKSEIRSKTLKVQNF